VLASRKSLSLNRLKLLRTPHASASKRCEFSGSLSGSTCVLTTCSKSKGKHWAQLVRPEDDIVTFGDELKEVEEDEDSAGNATDLDGEMDELEEDPDAEEAPESEYAAIRNEAQQSRLRYLHSIDSIVATRIRNFWKHHRNIFTIKFAKLRGSDYESLLYHFPPHTQEVCAPFISGSISGSTNYCPRRLKLLALRCSRQPNSSLCKTMPSCAISSHTVG
jgi:hypothetical protein